MSEAQHDKPADAWGQPVSDERQAELQGYLDRWAAESNHGERQGPFDTVFLTGADVFWLRLRVLSDTLDVQAVSEQLSQLQVPNPKHADALHLERSNLYEAHLERADLRGVHLEHAILDGAHLERAVLSWAHLQGAYLQGAHLERALLDGAHLERAVLRWAHLESTDLNVAHLEGALLSQSWLDNRTVLNNAHFDSATCLGDVQWSGVGAVNLTLIAWDRVPTLGDEDGVDFRADVVDHEQAVRAYRQVAAQLRAQGMSEVADRYLHRAQVRQRRLLLRRRRIPQWLGSWFLAALAGYGYRPGRTILWYLAVVSGFATAYYLVGQPSGIIPGPIDAAVFSLASFHGRGFFPGESLTLHSPVTVLAALEAVIGLLIEISFIATFTQRFFNSR